MKTSTEYKQALLDLFQALPYGSIKTICDRLDVSRAAVYSVRTCRFHNEAIIEEAKRILLESKDSNKSNEANLIEFVRDEVQKNIVSA